MLQSNWNQIIAKLPSPHLLQTDEWIRVKQRYGWEVIYKTWDNESGNIIAAAAILKRPITLGPIATPLCVLYIPRGPILDWTNLALVNRVISDLEQFAQQQNAIFLKFDPELPIGTGIPGQEDETNDPNGLEMLDELHNRGWLYSAEQIQFKNTVIISLGEDEEQLLANMKQKTRYNIRLAIRKGVTVRKGSPSDFDQLYQMYAETSVRDQFVIRSQSYYHFVWEQFWRAGMLTPLVAEVEGMPVAALMLFHFGESAWYLYGMSTNEHRNLMPTYLLQWEAIRTAKELGCSRYDLWGAPDVFDESDSMWGVFRFKQGLKGETLRTIGAWDFPCKPWLYKLYTNILPQVLKIMRSIGKRKTMRDLAQ